MHSLLINMSFLGCVKRVAPLIQKYYRLLYNGISLFTLVPLVILTKKMAGDVVFQWQGFGHLFRVVLICCSLYLFWGGSRAYDFQTFLGIRQYRSGQNPLLLTKTGAFSEDGVFAITRHPWYLGSLFLLWSLPASYPAGIFLAVCVLSLYLIVGTILEERKIVAQYGESYLRYSERVSMLFPRRWIVSFFARKFHKKSKDNL